MKICFLFPKDPYGYSGGDTSIFRVILEEASTLADVHALALTNGLSPQATIPIRAIPKRDVQRSRLVLRSLWERRSTVHTRFTTRELTKAICEQHVDRFVAEHTYMAEAAMDANVDSPVFINCHGFEADVFASRQDIPLLLRRVESSRIWHDEVRCLRNAAGVRCLGDDEVTRLNAKGITAAHLDIVLPPKQRSGVIGDQIALFLGDRLWPPNLEALREAERLWPEIRRRVGGAQLLVVGRGPYPPGQAPEGVERLGFVEDLGAIWERVRVLVAPVRTGGGVRVKILDAASRGIPIVTTSVGLGSIDRYLPIQAAVDDDAFVTRTALLLDDRDKAESEGLRLWEANRDCWRDGMVRRQIADWLEL